MWRIDYRSRKGTTTTQHETTAATLAVFLNVCDGGAPGRYTLRSSQNAVLATGDASFTINAYYIQNRKKVSMTKQQREDRARICAQLGITKEQYDEIDRACERAARSINRNAIRRVAQRAKAKK